PEVTISTVLGLIRRIFPSIRFPRLHPACLSIPVLPGTCPLLPRPQYSSTVQIRAGTPVSHLQQSTISFLSTSFSTQKGRSWKAHGCPQTPNPIVSILFLFSCFHPDNGGNDPRKTQTAGNHKRRNRCVLPGFRCIYRGCRCFRRLRRFFRLRLI